MFGNHRRRHQQLTRTNSQGWTWQESALSVRLMNFAPSELIWECREEVASECGYEPQSIPSLGLARIYHEVEEQPFPLWQDMVQTYTARSLRHYTDVLPAISGLAKKVQESTESGYLAGIWEEELVPGLLWESTPGIMQPRPKVPVLEPPRKCRAPSWSWASVEGPVRTSGTRMGNSTKAAGYWGPGGPTAVDRSYAAMTPEIRGYEVDDVDTSNLGEAAGGSITLSGRMIQVKLICELKVTTGWSYFVEYPVTPSPWQQAIRSPFSPDTELDLDDIGQAWPGPPTVKRTNVAPARGFRAPAHCLLIASAPGVQGQRETHDGIVLGRSKGNTNLFKRVGYFSFSNSSWFDGVGYTNVTIV